MTPQFCISTTTTAFPLSVVVPVTGTLNVVDAQNNPYYAISCATTSQTTYTTTVSSVDNTYAPYFYGIIVFIACMIFAIWFFARKR